MENPTIAEKLSPVLDEEREINNALNWRRKTGDGPGYPEWVRIGRLKHAARLVEGGTSIADAATAIGISHMTLNAWRVLHGIMDTHRSGPNKGKKIAIPPGWPGHKDSTPDPKRRAAGQKGAEARWGKARKETMETKQKRHYNRRKGYHRTFYSYAEKQEYADRARELIARGKAKNVSQAAKLLGMAQGTLSLWVRGKFGENRQEKIVGGTNGTLKISMPVARAALDEIVGSRLTDDQRKNMHLMFENAILRRMLQ